MTNARRRHAGPRGKRSTRQRSPHAEDPTMNGGLKTSLDLDEGPVFVHVIQHAPNQGVIAQIKDKPVRIPETLAEPGEQHPGEIARGGAQLRPHVHENGIAPDHGKKERQPVQFQHIRQQVEQGQQEIAPSRRPQYHGAGEQMLDDRKIQAPDISQNQAARTCAKQPRQLLPVPLHPFQNLAAQQPEHGHGPKAELGQNPRVIRLILPIPHQVLVQQQCQVPSRFQHPCRAGTHYGVGKRNELHDQPVHNQQQPCYHYLPPDGQMKKANSRNQVAGGDGLERIAVQGHLGRFKT